MRKQKHEHSKIQKRHLKFEKYHQKVNEHFNKSKSQWRKTSTFLPGEFSLTISIFHFSYFQWLFDSLISCIFKILSSWIVERSNLHGLFKFLISSILNFHVFIDFFGLWISRVFFFTLSNLRCHFWIFYLQSLCPFWEKFCMPVRKLSFGPSGRPYAYNQGLPSALPRFLARRMDPLGKLQKRHRKGKPWSWYNMGVSKHMGTPKWMVKIMDNPIENGWFGGYHCWIWYNMLKPIYCQLAVQMISNEW